MKDGNYYSFAYSMYVLRNSRISTEYSAVVSDVVSLTDIDLKPHPLFRNLMCSRKSMLDLHLDL